jgi:hypothetical protein
MLLLVTLKCPCFCTCILAISVFKTFAIGPAVAGVAKLLLTSLLLLVLVAGVPTIEWRPICSVVASSPAVSSIPLLASLLLKTLLILASLRGIKN